MQSALTVLIVGEISAIPEKCLSTHCRCRLRWRSSGMAFLRFAI